MARTNVRPIRTLVVLGVVVAALFGLMAGMRTWTPKLGLDLQGGTTVTLTASTSTGQVSQDSLEQARTIIQNRVDALGVGETEVTTASGNQIIVSVPNVQQDELVRMVGTTAVLSFRRVLDVQAAAPGTPTDPDSQEPSLPFEPRPRAAGSGWGPEEAMTWQPSQNDLADFAAYTCGDSFPEVSDQPLFACNEAGTEKYLLGPAMIRGDQLSNASAGIPQNEFEWIVELEFDGEGARLFETATRELSQSPEPFNRFAIVLDGAVISAPSVDQPIPGGRASIRGGFNQAAATELANVLKYGSLPLSFEVSSVDNVSASLGGEQLRAGIIAGLIGLILVLGFAIYIYRSLAVVIAASLALALVITYQLMTILGEAIGMALNLPGIAGFIIGIGMTADSFIIYFERIKDEIRQGRTVRSAVETGWERTKSTLMISNGVQALAAVILFVLAIGAVKGFAFVLFLSTVIDLALIFWFSKPIMSLLARTRFFGEGHKWSGISSAMVGVKELPGSRRRRRSAAKEVTADV